MSMDIDVLIALQEKEFNDALVDAAPTPQKARNPRRVLLDSKPAAKPAKPLAKPLAKQEPVEKARAPAMPPMPPPAVPAPAATTPQAEDDDDEALFKELKQLLDTGKITQQEYDEAMSGGLDEPATPQTTAQPTPAPAPAPAAPTSTSTSTSASAATVTISLASPAKKPAQRPRPAPITPPPAPPAAAAGAARALLMSPETAGLLQEMQSLLANGSISKEEFDEATTGMGISAEEASAQV